MRAWALGLSFFNEPIWRIIHVREQLQNAALPSVPACLFPVPSLASKCFFSFIFLAQVERSSWWVADVWLGGGVPMAVGTEIFESGVHSCTQCRPLCGEEGTRRLRLCSDVAHNCFLCANRARSHVSLEQGTSRMARFYCDAIFFSLCFTF